MEKEFETGILRRKPGLLEWHILFVSPVLCPVFFFLITVFFLKEQRATDF